MPPGPELPPDETVFRRIAEKQVLSMRWIREDGAIDYAAFLPNKGDSQGLSLTRAASAEEAAKLAPKGKRFYFVPLKVEHMKGMVVRETSGTHAVIEGWVFKSRDDDVVRNGAQFLTTVCGKPLGPFDGES